ncbi:hypothetical protein [Burkholderia sp. 1B3(2022)]|uniref:hypothetical protein n=1 Tax=Burkholderia sp. 1B3(2022) TaxID=2997425 RepID=UPI003FA5C659
MNEQAGIQAGEGGFNVNVKGNTDLTGAAIASTADPSKNTLTTGTLTYRDIENHSTYNADSSGFSAGAGVGVTGKSIGPGSVSGAGGVTPMISQSDSGSENATTRSGVSVGTINITNPAGQTQDVANLNRDTSNLNGTVSKTPDVQNLLDKQADTMNAAQAAGQVVAQGIGAYADMKQKEAQHAADAAKLAGDTTAQAAYQAEADSWDEGGTNRLYLHIAGGALIGGLGGGGVGSAAQGAAGAGLAALLADQTKQAANAVAGATDSTLAGKVSGNLLIGALGGLVGGTAGAATASNVNLYNQWNHTDTDTLEEASGQGTPRKKTTALDLIFQGIANGLNAISGFGGGKPPTASPGLVFVGEGAGGPTVQSRGAGYGPGNVMLNSGNAENANSNSNTNGKSRNKPPAPLQEAEGLPHTIIERPGPDGQYTTYNGDGTSMQYRGSGQDHGGIPRPNVKETTINVAPDGTVFVGKGVVRPARPNEIPKGK